MKIRCTVPLTATMMCILLAMPASAGAGSDHKTLQVKLNYSGAGIVDEKHKMYVLLFDANPFTATSLIDSSSDPATPAVAAGVSHILRRLSASEKNATVTFTNLGSPTVYAAAFADRVAPMTATQTPPEALPWESTGKPRTRSSRSSWKIVRTWKSSSPSTIPSRRLDAG